MINVICAACSHEIDALAKICPYCGANPTTGEKSVESERLMQEVFQPREVTASESVMEYARQRQGVFIAVASIITFVVLGAIHQFVTRRNATAVANTPPVPLTEITDLANRTDETKPVPMPELKFQYEGRADAMRTFIVEPGAVTPPEVIAARQAAAAAAAAERAVATRPPGSAAPVPQRVGAPVAQSGRPPMQPPVRPAPVRQ